MSAELKRLIKNLPKKSLEGYFTKFHADLVGEINWSEDETAIKKSLKEICLALAGEPFALIESEQIYQRFTCCF